MKDGGWHLKLPGTPFTLEAGVFGQVDLGALSGEFDPLGRSYLIIRTRSAGWTKPVGPSPPHGSRTFGMTPKFGEEGTVFSNYVGGQTRECDTRLRVLSADGVMAGRLEQPPGGPDLCGLWPPADEFASVLIMVDHGAFETYQRWSLDDLRYPSRDSGGVTAWGDPVGDPREPYGPFTPAGPIRSGVHDLLIGLSVETGNGLPTTPWAGDLIYHRMVYAGVDVSSKDWSNLTETERDTRITTDDQGNELRIGGDVGFGWTDPGVNGAPRYTTRAEVQRRLGAGTAATDAPVDNAIAAAADWIDRYIGGNPPQPIPPAIVEATTLLAVQMYRRADAPYGGAGSDYAGDLAVTEPLDAEIARLLLGYRQRFPVA